MRDLCPARGSAGGGAAELGRVQPDAQRRPGGGRDHHRGLRRRRRLCGERGQLYSAGWVRSACWHPQTPPPTTSPGALRGRGRRRAALCGAVAEPDAGAAARALFGFSGIVIMALLPLSPKEQLQGGSLLFGLLLGCLALAPSPAPC